VVDNEIWQPKKRSRHVRSAKPRHVGHAIFRRPRCVSLLLGHWY